MGDLVKFDIFHFIICEYEIQCRAEATSDEFQVNDHMK
jgi:hypothetical protein